MVTNYFRNLIQNHVFRENGTFPTKFYFALSTTAPNQNGTGITEPVGNGYTRVLVDRNTTNFTASVDGTIKNVSNVIFPEATGDWGLISHYGIYDAQTGGNLLFGGALTTAKTIETETRPEFKANAMEITLQ